MQSQDCFKEAVLTASLCSVLWKTQTRKKHLHILIGPTNAHFYCYIFHSSLAPTVSV